LVKPSACVALAAPTQCPYHPDHHLDTLHHTTTMMLATAAPPAPTAGIEASGAAAAIRNGATHPSAAATSTATKAGGVSTEPVPAAWEFKAGTEWYVCLAEGGREGGLVVS